MGVDAQFKMVTPPADYEALRVEFRRDWPVEYQSGGDDWPYIDESGEVHSLWRYYGIGYERGPWPDIRRMIEWLMARSPDGVRYGGDHTDIDEFPPITVAELDQINAHYAEHGHEPYLSFFRR